jgi:hypothetical protein
MLEWLKSYIKDHLSWFYIGQIINVNFIWHSKYMVYVCGGLSFYLIISMVALANARATFRNI